MDALFSFGATQCTASRSFSRNVHVLEQMITSPLNPCLYSVILIFFFHVLIRAIWELPYIPFWYKAGYK